LNESLLQNPLLSGFGKLAGKNCIQLSARRNLFKSASGIATENNKLNKFQNISAEER